MECPKLLLFWLISQVYNFVQLAVLYYAGSHGMDIKGPAKGKKYKKGKKAILFQPASEFLPMIDEVYKTLVEKTKPTPGAKVENNKFCLSMHFRCVDEKIWTAEDASVQAPSTVAVGSEPGLLLYDVLCFCFGSMLSRSIPHCL